MSNYLGAGPRDAFTIFKRAIYLIFSSIPLMLLIAVLCMLQWMFEYNKPYLHPELLYTLVDQEQASEWIYNSFISSFCAWQWVYIFIVGFFIFFVATNGYHTQVHGHHVSISSVLLRSIKRFPYFLGTVAIVYILLIFGLVIFVIPGLFAILYFSAVPGVLASESFGVVESISAAVRLSAKHKMLSLKTLFMALLGLILMVFVSMVLLSLLRSFAPHMQEWMLMTLYYGILLVLDTLAFAFVAAIYVLHYENLKLAKEAG